jgi:four helix bundle protein
MKPNILLEKTFAFAVEIVLLTRNLQTDHKEYILTRQLLRAATSIGANAEEAIAGQSTSDFIAKLSIALKEARETKYWLRLISASNLHDCKTQIDTCDQIMKIISSIIMTTKARYTKPREQTHNS